ncbi:hypothetical protein EJ377_01895 [Chryseobacterium arthrosphaerae]|uniref:Uncharacterized protein n=1 Tax=Chryseobacterium arthrosphaerae TaxID=651561 RepID=A0A432DYX7_9FLAO|nr:hypothetical protein EJ377_01895 [Chryseobacterium arthrosphaerae]
MAFKSTFQTNQETYCQPGNSITDLLAALAHLNNIYKPGRLLDCDANDNDTLDGKIILGQSNLSKIKNNEY